MPTSDFLPFGTGGSPNVLAQAAYAALAARTAGFSAGVAKSNEVNKVLRQAAFVAAAVAQAAADNSGLDVLDDGDLAGLVSKIKSGFGSAGSLALSGWVRLPGRLIMQWGEVTTTQPSGPGVTGFGVAALPTAFPNFALRGFCTLTDGGITGVDWSGAVVFVDNLTTTQIQVNGVAGDYTPTRGMKANFLALGY
jgi:hypothetical protein